MCVCLSHRGIICATYSHTTTSKKYSKYLRLVPTPATTSDNFGVASHLACAYEYPSAFVFTTVSQRMFIWFIWVYVFLFSFGCIAHYMHTRQHAYSRNTHTKPSCEPHTGLLTSISKMFAYICVCVFVSVGYVGSCVRNRHECVSAMARRSPWCPAPVVHSSKRHTAYAKIFIIILKFVFMLLRCSWCL